MNNNYVINTSNYISKSYSFSQLNNTNFQKSYTMKLFFFQLFLTDNLSRNK